MSSHDLESLTRLRIRHGVTWQGGLRRLPMWVTPSGQPPYRPRGALWVSSVGKIHTGDVVEPEKASAEMVLDAFIQFARHEKWGGYLPEQVEVADPAEAALLEPVLSPLGIPVRVIGRLRIVEGALSELAGSADSNAAQGILEAPDVTLERARSFADAARLFYESEPWRHLSDEDLIRVEAPHGPPDARYGLVLGAAGQEYGLLLFESPRFADRIRRRNEQDPFERDSAWCVFFGPVIEVPLGDADLFEDHAFPVAGPEAYPWAAQLGPRHRMRRPGLRALRHLDALLRALAATTENEIDSGRWTRVVPTPDGAIPVTLALPALLEPGRPTGEEAPFHEGRGPERMLLEVERFLSRERFADPEVAMRAVNEKFVGRTDEDLASSATTPLERAQDLCYRAMEARGRMRSKLAREALALSPDCADAYVLLAERARDLEENAALLEQAVAAGERMLGPGRFESKKKRPPFWSDVATRPYMRALLGLAQCRQAQHRTRDAISIYERMLELNPNDNQGVRTELVPLLLEAGDDAKAADLLEHYAEDGMATMEYSRALLAFREKGDSPASRRALRKAMEANPHVPALLLDSAKPPTELPRTYTFGDENEAAICRHEIAAAWCKTDGALAWLEKRAK